jgi:hypothetical protein
MDRWAILCGARHRAPNHDCNNPGHYSDTHIRDERGFGQMLAVLIEAPAYPVPE